MHRFTTRHGLAALLMLGLLVPALHVSAQSVAAPEGEIVQRYIDLAAEQAFDQWIGDLGADAKTEPVQRIGMLRLDRDPGNLTSILQGKLTRLDQIRVVTLGGSVWNAIERELARTDPDEGYGDIFDRATIVWREDGGFPETTLGADALLLGHVRSVEHTWLRTIVRVQIFLARIDNREQLAGGVYTGEAVLSPRDFMFYYSTQLIWGAGIFIALIIVLCVLRSLFKSMSRPR
jgi:hypothetical protein